MGEGCFAWRVCATVSSAIAIGTLLRMMLPPDARYVLAECALATVVGVTVAVRPGVLMSLCRGVKRVVSGVGGALCPPALAVSARRVEVHTHAGYGTKTAARHEAGHRRMAKAMGWQVHSAEIFPDGTGVTKLYIPKTAAAAELVAISAAGGIASGTWSGCSSDMARMKADLKRLPAGERGAAKRDGYALARRTVGGWVFDGGVSADAARIFQNGRI